MAAFAVVPGSPLVLRLAKRCVVQRGLVVVDVGVDFGGVPDIISCASRLYETQRSRDLIFSQLYPRFDI